MYRQVGSWHPRSLPANLEVSKAWVVGESLILVRWEGKRAERVGIFLVLRIFLRQIVSHDRIRQKTGQANWGKHTSRGNLWLFSILVPLHVPKLCTYFPLKEESCQGQNKFKGPHQIIVLESRTFKRIKNRTQMGMDSLVFFFPEIIKHEFVQIICGHLFFSFQMLFFSHRPGSNSFLETALSVPFPTPAPSAMERHRGECFLTLPCSFTSIHGLQTLNSGLAFSLFGGTWGQTV